jgi:DNA-directed RNA polymerase subunit RPC12/RpoP
MARVYRCDRCKKEDENRPDFLRMIDIPRMNNSHGVEFTDEDTYSKELCAECWSKVELLVRDNTLVLRKP